MDTIRVEIQYRPVRVAWVIMSNDMDAFRKAVNYSLLHWGGIYNPIVFADRPEEAKKLIDLFKVDLLFQINETDQTCALLKDHEYLDSEYFGASPFKKDFRSLTRTKFVDIENILTKLRSSDQARSLHFFDWDEDDKLADAFLMQFGARQFSSFLGDGFRQRIANQFGVKTIRLPINEVIPEDVMSLDGVVEMNRYGLSPGLMATWIKAGFFLGYASEITDLQCFWNLRALGAEVWFIDPFYMERHKRLFPKWSAKHKNYSSFGLVEPLKLWFQPHLKTFAEQKVRNMYPDLELSCETINDSFWEPNRRRPTWLSSGEFVELGMDFSNGERTKVSFSLGSKPCSEESRFSDQYLMACLAFNGSFQNDSVITLQLPRLRELNGYYSRMLRSTAFRSVRLDNRGLGLMVSASEKHTFVYPLAMSGLFEQVFAIAGCDAKMSQAGLILKQFVAYLDGVHGTQLFKIPGVRELVKTYGPTKTFTKKAATQALTKTADLSSNFRALLEELIVVRAGDDRRVLADRVFDHMVEKGLFRIGRELSCPRCNLSNWIVLDQLKKMVVCDLCDNRYDTTGQLTQDQYWGYRRSGVLGIQKDLQGAIPVALTLQYLHNVLTRFDAINAYSPSLELSFAGPDGETDAKCEIDLVWLTQKMLKQKVSLILGECKDQGPKIEEFRKEFESLERIATRFPQDRFDVFLLFTKLAPFTADEIEIANSVNQRLNGKVILLSTDELQRFGLAQSYGSEGPDSAAFIDSPDCLVAETHRRYF